jgi:hypothetical protein
MNPAAVSFKGALRSRYFVSHEISPFKRLEIAVLKPPTNVSGGLYLPAACGREDWTRAAEALRIARST